MNKKALESPDTLRYEMRQTRSYGPSHFPFWIVIVAVALLALFLHLIVSTVRNNHRHDKEFVGTYIGKDGSGLALHADGTAELYTVQMDSVETGDTWKNSSERLTVKCRGKGGYTLFADVANKKADEFNLNCDDKNKWIAEDFYKFSEEDKSLSEKEYNDIWAEKFGQTGSTSLYDVNFNIPKYYSLLRSGEDYQAFVSVDRHSRIYPMFVSTTDISDSAPSVFFIENLDSVKKIMDKSIETLCDLMDVTSERNGSYSKKIINIDGLETRYKIHRNDDNVDYPITGKCFSFPLNDKRGIFLFVLLTEGNKINTVISDFDAMVDSATYSGKIIDAKTSDDAYYTPDPEHIRVSSSSSDYLFNLSNYKNIVRKFQDNGFTNVSTKPVYDIYFGITPEESVASVSINGSTDFSKGDIFEKTASVVVEYHMPYEEEPTE